MVNPVSEVPKKCRLPYSSPRLAVTFRPQIRKPCSAEEIVGADQQSLKFFDGFLSGSLSVNPAGNRSRDAPKKTFVAEVLDWREAG